ncbi:MAG TPA: Mur ligase [Clostridia bacterium]|nr:Mur ligase [Clostridia bacterium]
MVHILIGGSLEKGVLIKFLSSSLKEVSIKELKEYKEKADILIISNILNEEDFNKLKNYIYKFTIPIIITNGDDKLSNGLFTEGINSMLITCGLNSKSSVTASSITYEEESYRFNYCVQRAFFNLEGVLIEPMEIPVEIKISGQYNIYNSLFVITVLLILGYVTEDVQNIIGRASNN